jgi:hypothetical protein
VKRVAHDVRVWRWGRTVHYTDIDVEPHCLRFLLSILGKNGSENHSFGWKTPENGSIKQIFQAETDLRRPETWTLRAPRAGPRPRKRPTPRRRKCSARASRSSSASSGEPKSEPKIARTDRLKKCFSPKRIYFRNIVAKTDRLKKHFRRPKRRQCDSTVQSNQNTKHIKNNT